MDITCEYEISQTRYRCIVKKLVWNDTSTVRVFEKHDGKDVQEVEIQDIHLDKFPRGIGKAFPCLKRLWIVNCGIQKISRRDFSDLGNLKTLNLKRNFITELKDGVFDKLPGLVYLSLSHNYISHIDTKIFEPLKNLDRLNMQTNITVNCVWKDLLKSENFKFAMNQIEERCKPISETSKSEPKTPSPPPRCTELDDSKPPSRRRLLTNDDETVFKKFKLSSEPSGYLHPSIDEAKSIYIGNVHFNVTPEIMRNKFHRFGDINNIIIPRQHGEPKGYAFVEFESREAVGRSLDMNDCDFMGRRIRVMRKLPARRDPEFSKDPTKKPRYEDRFDDKHK